MQIEPAMKLHPLPRDSRLEGSGDFPEAMEASEGPHHSDQMPRQKMMTPVMAISVKKFARTSKRTLSSRACWMASCTASCTASWTAWPQACAPVTLSDASLTVVKWRHQTGAFQADQSLAASLRVIYSCQMRQLQLSGGDTRLGPSRQIRALPQGWTARILVPQTYKEVACIPASYILHCALNSVVDSLVGDVNCGFAECL